MENWNKLRDMCDANARKIYGRLLPAFVKERLEEELEYIKKNGWAKDFLDAAEFMAGDYFTKDDRFNKGFRCSLGSSFAAYLCNITAMNPLEFYKYRKMSLYSRMFYEKEKLMFYINLPDRIIKEVEQREIKVPECMCLLSSKNLTLLDQLQRATGEKYCCRIQSDLKSTIGNYMALFLYEDGFDEKGYPSEGNVLAGCIPEFEGGSELFVEILDTMRLYARLPRTITEMAQILGLLHGQGTWIENAQELYLQCDCEGKNVNEYLITCVEDVYEILKEKGISDDEAMEIALNVGKGYRRVSREDIMQMEEAGCDELFLESVRKIDYLFSRAQCLQYAWETVRIIYYLLYFKEQYMKEIEYERD